MAALVTIGILAAIVALYVLTSERRDVDEEHRAMNQIYDRWSEMELGRHADD